MQYYKNLASSMLGRRLHPPGNSLLEQLPNELLFRILDLLLLQRPATISEPRDWFMVKNLPSAPNDTQPNFSLSSCLRVCRRLHEVSLPLLYRDIQMVQQQTNIISNTKPLQGIRENPSLASLIRSLDHSEYFTLDNSSHLSQALSLIPGLRSLHVQLGDLKSLDDPSVQNIFFGMRDLETLIIENTFSEIQPSVLADILRKVGYVESACFSNIRSLTCRSSEDSIRNWAEAYRTDLVDTDLFSAFLPRFPKLRALDLSSTSINPASLFSINSNTRLQYLRVSNCQDKDTFNLAHFLATHPAATSSLIVFDGSGVSFTAQDTTTILENLPRTLRSLNLSRSSMSASHIPSLQRLCGHLEELSVGYGLTMDGVEAMIMAPYFEFDQEDTRSFFNEPANSKDALGHARVLAPMRDAIAICKLRQRLASVTPKSSSIGVQQSNVRHLDLNSIADAEQGRITSSVLLGEHSRPLQLIEVSDIRSEDYRILHKVSDVSGWSDKWVNRRTWVERLE